MKPYPLKFENVFLEKIWGGDGLRRHLGKALPAGMKIGESWELSAQGSHVSRIKNGPLAGKLLSDVIPGFPLLFKFIDAQERLSVQVHPVDAPGRKTEAWHIVYARPGARMICGLKKGVTRKDVEKGVHDNSLECALTEFTIRAGDTIFVPAGTVHAIMEGTLLYEIQETSDTTYRLYDWGRPRPLHVEESLRALVPDQGGDHRTKPAQAAQENGERAILAACPYFVLEKLRLTARAGRPAGHGFEVLSVLSGQGNVYYEGGREPLAPGETILLPDGLGSCALEPVSGELAVLLSWAPPAGKGLREVLAGEGVTPEAMQGLGGMP